MAWLFALPFVLVFAVFMLGPLVSSFLMSFTDFTSRDIENPLAVGFVGIDQYAAPFRNPQFLHSVAEHGLLRGGRHPAHHGPGPGACGGPEQRHHPFPHGLPRGFYTPVVTSIVAVAVVWRFILQPDGLLNVMLGWVGIAGPDWLNSTTWSMPALILLAVWRNMGTLMIIFLAGLQAVPGRHPGSRRIDGANAWQRFLRITLPCCARPCCWERCCSRSGFLQFFEEPFVMTKGGPLDSTLSISYFTYNQFGFGKYGLASAASYVLFVAIALLSLVQFRALRSKD